MYLLKIKSILFQNHNIVVKCRNFNIENITRIQISPIVPQVFFLKIYVQ